jgi:hypothetical protein
MPTIFKLQFHISNQYFSISRKIWCRLILILVVTWIVPWAFPLTVFSQYQDAPSSFTAEYVAKYGGFRASAERSLTKDNARNFVLHSSMKVKLLGQTLSEIRETSEFTLNDETGQAKPVFYEFNQTGVGERKRQITFDWEQSNSTIQIEHQEINIPLEGNEMDNLSAYVEIRRQLMAGNKEITFPGIYKGELEEIHYQVTGEELIESLPGTFHTLRLERIREPDSDRSTLIWLAPEWDYLLVKLVQEEPGNSTISLELKSATVNDLPVLIPAEK